MNRRVRAAACLIVAMVTACGASPEPAPSPSVSAPASSGPASPSASPSAAVVEEARIDGPNGKIWAEIHRPAGEGPHPAIIYAPGLGVSYASGEPYAKALVEEGYVVYLFDFVGGNTTSRSGGDTKTMTMFTEVADLEAVTDHAARQGFVDPGRIHYVGVSHGGVVAALAASRRDDIASLVLLCPAFGIDDAIRSRYPAPADLPETYSILRMTLGRAYFEALHDVNLLRQASRYAGPVIIYHGVDDDIVPIAESRTAAAHFRDADLVALDGEGHFLSRESREAVLAGIRKFLRNR